MSVSYTHLDVYKRQPYAPILEEALKYFGLKKEDCILLGDNLETDILLGVDNGVESIMAVSYTHLDVYKRQQLFMLTQVIR